MRIVIRPVEITDHNFVFSTYLLNRFFEKTNNTTLKRSTWCALHHRRLEALLDRGEVLIACLDEDPDTILGYGLQDHDRQFTYVKLAYRAPGLEVSERLLKALNERNGI